MTNDTTEPPLVPPRSTQRRGRPPAYDPDQICPGEGCGQRRGDDPRRQKWCRGLCQTCYNRRSWAGTLDQINQAERTPVTGAEIDWDAAIRRLRTTLRGMYRR